MRKILLIALVALAGAGIGGCYVEDSYAAGPGYVSAGVAPVGYVEPEMVVVSPGVQVVYDYDYPVFFNAGFYWRYDGGIWYSSRYHTGGWVRSYNVPAGIRGINHPEGYAHYRPAGYTPHGGYRGNVAREGYRQPAPTHYTNNQPTHYTNSQPTHYTNSRPAPTHYSTPKSHH